jgi:outer membrane protein TolC
MFTPQFFSQYVQQIDKKPKANLLEGKRLEAQQLSLGVQKLWSFGLQSQLSYNLSDVFIDRDAVSPSLLAPGVPNPLVVFGKDSEYKEAQTKLELVQSLWKNGFGDEYDLQRESLQAKLSMQRAGEQYRMRAILAQAEITYWKLALANEAVRTQQGSLARFQKIREWAARRVSMQLADRADLLQAEAGVKAKRYELELAQRDRILAQRAFNTLRAATGDQVEGDLAPIPSRLLTEARPPQGGVKRLDVDVARAQEKVSELEVAQNRERFQPQLDLFGTVALNSEQESELGKAAGGAFTTEKPTYIVGIKIAMPLDRDLINQDRNGLVKASEAARYDREQKEFQARQEWEELQRQLGDGRTRLQLMLEIESAQKEKLDYEKQRFERGRSTTFQILQFENDYANAQLGAIKARTDILEIMAKLKTFGDAL